MPDGPFHDRNEDPLFQRFLAALVVSLLAHISLVAVVQLGNQLRWWDARPFAMFRKVRFTPEEISRLKEQKQQREQERPETTLTFVQVTQPSEEPPEAKYYSSQSSRAANPLPDNSNQPRIDGRQTQSIRTEDAPRIPVGTPSPPPQPPAQPDKTPPSERALPPVAQPPPPQPEAVRPLEAPKVAERPVEPIKVPGLGELATVKPEPVPVVTQVVASAASPAPVVSNSPPAKPTVAPQVPTTASTTAPTTTAPRPRPRTITEAKVRQELLAGEKMRQPGGVARRGPVALDVKGTQFGAYDEALVMAVQNRWFALLDERRFAGEGTGKVVVTFKLYADGSVRIVEPQESTVQDAMLALLCVRAVRDPSPYEKWPSDMMRMVGSNFREMRFTFFYN